MGALGNKRWRFHGLKKPKIRADWNKYNLYNLSQMRSGERPNRTYFARKWAAKSATRAYHGEQIKEKHWQRMFSRVAPAVVPMPAADLAHSDGSELAEGRGSGKEEAPTPAKTTGPRTKSQAKPAALTPYVQATFWPVERRLDNAVFRALFASSVRQARQMVVHGHVRINGKKMPYPGYLLNPGDMFQIDPEAALIATSATKGRSSRRAKVLAHATAQADEPEEVSRRGRNASRVLPEPNKREEDVVEDEDVQDPSEEELQIPEASEDPDIATKKTIVTLYHRVKSFLATPPERLSVKQKQNLRALQKQIKSRLSNYKKLSAEQLSSIETETESLIAQASTPEPSASSAAAPSDTTPTTPAAKTAPRSVGNALLAAPNVKDSTKSYPTPWMPKDYMSAFAFIPRYLEVSQNIFSAVYLRHPVVKPGFGEVPTPFNTATSTLAFNWYLRRR